MLLVGIVAPLNTTYAFTSSTEAFQLLSDDSQTILTFFTYSQGVVRSAENTFVNQAWKLKVKLSIIGEIGVRILWAAGTNASNIRFDNDGNIVSSGQGGGAGVTPIGLEKDGEFFTISYPPFTPNGDVKITFNVPGGSVGSEIGGTNLDNYSEGLFCLSGSSFEGCPQEDMLDIFFVFNESGELPPPDLSSFDLFTSTSTLDALQTTCDTTSGLFANSICKMLAFLFVPNEAVLNQFENLRDDLEEKPPFGYLTAVISELENLETATATIAFPDLSDLQDNFFTPLKIGISTLLFFMLAFWFFQRFRDFDL